MKEDYKESLPGKFLTIQEHFLKGSTPELDINNDNFIGSAYTPIGVMLGEITPEECDYMRSLELGFNIFPWKINEVGSVGIAALERLDLDRNSLTYGQTVRDPSFIRPYDYEDSTEHFTTYPLARKEKMCSCC